MGSPAADIGTGITIVFGTSAFVAEVTDINGPGMTRESIDVSHQGTTDARIFIPADLFDAGEISFDIHFNPDTDPPIDKILEEIVVTWPAGATWTFDGFSTGYEPSTPLEDKMVGTVTVKVSGNVVIVAGP